MYAVALSDKPLEGVVIVVAFADTIQIPLDTYRGLFVVELAITVV
jgi:hypothetical protein